jgi:hypothetical protein
MITICLIHCPSFYLPHLDEDNGFDESRTFVPFPEEDAFLVSSLTVENGSAYLQGVIINEYFTRSHTISTKTIQ